ncbi:hypothetical protein AAZV13_13G004300 [Glycine max]
MYDIVFHGFSAKLSPSEAHKLQSLSHVITLMPKQICSLHTTHSFEFLGLATADRVKLLHETNFRSFACLDHLL